MGKKDTRLKFIFYLCYFLAVMNVVLTASIFAQFSWLVLAFYLAGAFIWLRILAIGLKKIKEYLEVE